MSEPSKEALKAVRSLCTCFDKGADGHHAIGCKAPKAAALLERWAATEGTRDAFAAGRQRGFDEAKEMAAQHIRALEPKP